MLNKLRERKLVKAWQGLQIADCEEDNVNLQAERINVLNLLRGRSSPQSKQRSLLFFSIHRGGSSYAGSLLGWLAHQHQMLPVNLEAHWFNYSNRLLEVKYGRQFAESFLYADHPTDSPNRRALRDIFRKRGHYYGAFRDPFLLQSIPHRDQFAIIVLVRDPRDVLTSMYFAVKQSHVMPAKNASWAARMQTWRGKAQKRTIDDFVVKAADGFLSRFQLYVDLMGESGNISLVRYEDMVLDYPRWVDQILDASGLGRNEDIRQALINAEDVRVECERPGAHKRQVLPGDHLRKLKPDTIEYLNGVFSDVLTSLKYPQDARAIAAA